MRSIVLTSVIPCVVLLAGTVFGYQDGVGNSRVNELKQDRANELALVDDMADDKTESLVLFDGTSLEGWEGEEGLWSIEDGAITGRTTEETRLKANSFLVWRGELPEDFELTLEFRIESGNSGIQFRSEEIEPFRVKGYQADIDSTMKFMGILYEERARGILCQRGQRVSIAADGKRTEPESTGLVEDDFQAGYKAAEWHHYVITANGPQITCKIDDQITAELNDEQEDASRRNGIIGLQLHVGPPMKVQFRNIVLKSLGEPAGDKHEPKTKTGDGGQ